MTALILAGNDVEGRLAPPRLAREAVATALTQAPGRQGNGDNVARKKRRRATLERVVEKALDRLDRLDGDPDLEPSLGWPEHSEHWKRHDHAWAEYEAASAPLMHAADDREVDEDIEPSLCGCTADHVPSRSEWGPYTDLEQQCDDEGHESDLERVCEDEGAQCEDEGVEEGL